MKPHSKLAWWFAIIFWGLVGCGEVASPPPGTVPAGFSPTPTLAATMIAPTVTLAPDTGWELLRPGLERREMRIFSPGPERILRERIYMLRIDPAFYRFDVGYRPGKPQTLLDWQAETGAHIVLNGGFFTETYVATGLIIVNGVPDGVSYGGFAGMFAVTPAGPQVRWLETQPILPNETFQAGLQSFPVLVKPGGVKGVTTGDDQAARRTVIGQDFSGRIIMLVAARGHFTLMGLSEFLVESDLNLDIALNLDGGSSSGILVAEPDESIFPQAYVPAVITVYPR